MNVKHWVLSLVAVLGVLTTAPAMATTSCGNRFDLGRGPRLTIIGLTAEQRLVQFRECSPGRLSDVGRVSGLQSPDTALVGIDFRVQDGQLYGVGDGGGVYTIDTYTAAATWVSQLTADLDGTFFGVDFNPAADRLRIISDTGQNLRHNVNPGGMTLVDGLLNYTAGTTATGLSGAAYTNNDLNPSTGTTLFDIDTSLNQVVIQSPPNAGSLMPTGFLTVDPDTPVGFDIYTDLRNGVPLTDRGFASLVVGGVTGFYRVNMLTGQAILIGISTKRSSISPFPSISKESTAVAAGRTGAARTVGRGSEPLMARLCQYGQAVQKAAALRERPRGATHADAKSGHTTGAHRAPIHTPPPGTG